MKAPYFPGDEEMPKKLQSICKIRDELAESRSKVNRELAKQDLMTNGVKFVQIDIDEMEDEKARELKDEWKSLLRSMNKYKTWNTEFASIVAKYVKK